MTMSTEIFRSTIPLAALALLAACGEDTITGPPPAPTTAAGVYEGTLRGAPSAAPTFEAIILEDGEFWMLHGENFGSLFKVYGFVQGYGNSSGGTYTSTSAKDFGFVPPVNVSLSATYSANAKTVSGTIAYPVIDYAPDTPDAPVSFTTAFSGGPIQGTNYNYDSPAALSAVTGTWSLQTTQGDAATMIVAADGSLRFTTTSGCSGKGSLTPPRPSGKNVFNAAIIFDDNNTCLLSGQTITGIAITYPILSTNQSQFVIALTDASKTVGTAAFGVR
jgi:hypothetical protein